MRKITFDRRTNQGVNLATTGWVTPLSPYLVVHQLEDEGISGWVVTHLPSGLNCTAGRKVNSPEEAVKLVEDLVATGLDWSELNPGGDARTRRRMVEASGLLDRLHQLEATDMEIRNPVEWVNEVEV